MEKVLLHICCAVCATSCVERLRQEGYQPSGYFYNPNIQPQGEYLKRLQEVELFSRRENVPLIMGNYDSDLWSKQAECWAQEPEGGQRCHLCFKMRLEETAKLAKQRGFAYFTTTLTTSPHKDAQLINKIGQDLGGAMFLLRDFKKLDGFKRAQELSRKHNLYRQDYCGCLYSLEDSKNHERLHKKARPGGAEGKTAQD